MPPPLSQLYAEYLRDDPAKNLRFGQWFFNRFIRAQPTRSPHDFDTLYNATNFEVIYSIIERIYDDYQWPK